MRGFLHLELCAVVLGRKSYEITCNDKTRFFYVTFHKDGCQTSVLNMEQRYTPVAPISTPLNPVPVVIVICWPPRDIGDTDLWVIDERSSIMVRDMIS